VEGPIIALVFSTLYAVAISFGIGREMDDRVVTRPLIVAGGIVIVVIVKEWGNWAEMGEWLLWFGAAGIPQMVRVAVLHINADKKARLIRLSVASGPHANKESEGNSRDARSA
jgi:hypothetical protein